MEYHEAANFLFDLRRYPSREGLDATRALCDHLGNPQEDLTCVQIAGSNGKGSTARMVERTLREAGLDVGLYTSPHLSDLRERVRINGRKVTKRAVREYVESIRGHALDAAAGGDCPTFFESTTVLALWAFARADVDVAVLEVGIGGRYDATSVVDPLASAVTSVTLEHTALLGDTVEEIARDKAQVAGTSPLVTATTGDALAAVRDEVESVVTVGDGASPESPESPDVLARYEGRDGLSGRVTLDGPGWSIETRLSQLGAHQADNAGVAAALSRQVADSLDVPLDEATVERGLAGAHWPGRFEVMDRAPLTVLDGAHNPGSCESVAATLAEFDYDDLHLVFGAMSDKDHAGMAAALPRADHVYTCRADAERAESTEVLARVFEAGDRADEVHVGENVPDALAAAREAAGPDDAVLLTGSLYVVAEAREEWVRPETPKRVTTLEQAGGALESADVTEDDVRRLRREGVHRVVETRVRPRQARSLTEAMRSVGGECATSGLSTQDREPVDVVLMGTLAQFERLLDELAERPYGLRRVGERLRETLTVETPDYPWESRTAVMGIVNVTPDSFHDGGEYDSLDRARARAEAMVEAGVDILDVGGESTRPGADPVSADEELRRVVPLIERVADLDVLVSVDTRKAEVARAALDAGADIINDVTGLDDPGMREVVAEYQAPTVVMHSIDAPVDPDTDVEYDDVVEDVLDQLRERVLLAEKAGLDRSRIIVDPGLGFGKSKREGFELLDRLDEFHALGCPVLIGHSHKSMFSLVGETGGDAPAGTVAASALAADRGADVIRVHDVPENVVAVRTARALSDADERDES